MRTGEPAGAGGEASREGSAGRDVTAAARLFHGLADPARLSILLHLAFGEHRVRDLTDHLGLSQSTVSAHLACLRECGLVLSRPQGRASWHSLAAEPELACLLRAAEAVLAAGGAAATRCPTPGGPGPGGATSRPRAAAGGRR